MKINEYLLTEDELFELKMKSNFLKRRTSKIDPLIGIEFELIAPRTELKTNVEEDLNEIEATSFEMIKQYFEPYNPSRKIKRIMHQLTEEKDEYAETHALDMWMKVRQEYLNNYFLEQVWDVHDHYDQILSVVQNSFKDESDQESIKKAVQEFVADVLPISSEYFSPIQNVTKTVQRFAFDQFITSKQPYKVMEKYLRSKIESYTEEMFLKEKYPTLQRVKDDFNLDSAEDDYSNNNDNDISEYDLQALADSFSFITDLNVKTSLHYHGSMRDNSSYIIEPDSSIIPDEYESFGFELISPPLPFSKITKELENVIQWAATNELYTNDTCGLHINVSIKDQYIENLDYIKLTLLLGDKYILKEFSREFNEYANSVLDIISRKIKGKTPQYHERILNSLRSDINKKTSRLFEISLSGDKYRSINPHRSDNWRIEFRGPGGDWLNHSTDVLINTIARCVVALDAALDEKKYQEDYAKKLYKLLDSVRTPKESSLLSKYLSGQIGINEVRNALTVKKSQK